MISPEEQERIDKAQIEYEAKLTNTKAVRAEIDSDFRKVLFNKEIIIKNLAEVIFYAIHERFETYFEDGIVQTPYNKRRTIEDTYRIQKSYNIRCAFKDVKAAIEALEKDALLSVVFCKRTLVRTYSRVGYHHNITNFIDYLNKHNLNHDVKIIKRKITRNRKTVRI